MPHATVITGADGPCVQLARVVAASPESLWDMVTRRELLANWFPCDVVIEGDQWVRGASISFSFPADVADMTLAGEVLEAQRPHRLAFTWGEETLRFEIDVEESATRLTLTDCLAAPYAARNAAGWEVCLDRLCGAEVAPEAWRAHFDAYREAFEPQLGPQEGPPDTDAGG